MAELLLELLSEEIPARMQRGGAEELERLLGAALAPLEPRITTYHGPRRIAAVAEIAAEVPATVRSERGPRASAPDVALAGFLRKHGAVRSQLTQENDYWVLNLDNPSRPAAELIALALPKLLRKFFWPKSMRWGGTSAFSWVRPLRRILCLLDGEVVPFNLHDGDDDGHGLASGDLTEGHRFLASGAVAVNGVAAWKKTLDDRRVILDAGARQKMISDGLFDVANAQGLRVVWDETLLEEVAGLVEWPVPLLGRIDEAFMDLPPEVMQVSMRVHQRYFALKRPDGSAAPWFAFVANVAAGDDGVSIIAGNERVLRARFADARHFWDADREVSLRSRLPALQRVIFHANLGNQLERAKRLERLAKIVAKFVGANPEEAGQAGLLAKADLTTAMVGEFPELQGIMGSYYAEAETPKDVVEAIAAQYRPAGFEQAIVRNRVRVALVMADRLDTLVGFFGIGERPTGSGDPFALRRAALIIISLAINLPVEMPMRQLIAHAAEPFASQTDGEDVFAFIIERLVVFLRSTGERHDVLKAVFAAANNDDIGWLFSRTHELSEFLAGPDGPNLISSYRRAANILRIEDGLDGPHIGVVTKDLLVEEAESRLHELVEDVTGIIRNSDGYDAMTLLASLRGPLDTFFEQVLVNDYRRPNLRTNRLRLLSSVVASIDMIADFSKIEG